MGEAIALAFAAEGMNVAIAGRRQDKLDAVATASHQTTMANKMAGAAEVVRKDTKRKKTADKATEDALAFFKG